jgi:hypothetical protein
MSAYDRWLEAPYQRAAAEEAQFETFCENFDLDPEAPDSEQLFQDYISEDYREVEYEYEEEHSDH